MIREIERSGEQVYLRHEACSRRWAERREIVEMKFLNAKQRKLNRGDWGGGGAGLGMGSTCYGSVAPFFLWPFTRRSEF